VENILKVVQYYYDLKKIDKTLDYSFFDIDSGARKDYSKELYKELAEVTNKPTDINNSMIKFFTEKINDNINSELSIFR